MQRERPLVGPRPGVGLRVFNGHGVRHAPGIEAAECLRQVQCIAVRMTDSVEPCEAIESPRFDDQRISLPTCDRGTEPGRLDLLRPLCSNLHDVMPGVDLEQKGDVALVLHDLKRIRRVDRSLKSERETASGVVAGCGVIR